MKNIIISKSILSDYGHSRNSNDDQFSETAKHLCNKKLFKDTACYSEGTAIHEALHSVMLQYMFGQPGKIVLNNLLDDGMIKKGHLLFNEGIPINKSNSEKMLYVNLAGHVDDYLMEGGIDDMLWSYVDELRQHDNDIIEFDYYVAQENNFQHYFINGYIYKNKHLDYINQQNRNAFFIDYLINNTYNDDFAKSIDLIRELYSIYDPTLIIIKMDMIYGEILNIIKENNLVPVIEQIAINALNEAYGYEEYTSIDSSLNIIHQYC